MRRLLVFLIVTQEFDDCFLYPQIHHQLVNFLITTIDSAMPAISTWLLRCPSLPELAQNPEARLDGNWPTRAHGLEATLQARFGSILWYPLPHHDLLSHQIGYLVAPLPLASVLPLRPPTPSPR